MPLTALPPPRALVVAPQQLWQLLVEVEDDVCIPVLAGDGVCPQFLHEEDLVGELSRRICKLGVNTGIYKTSARRGKKYSY